jgi:uncharacterized protein (DUF2252 family)
LLLKLALLRKDAFAFFRGTNPLFLEFLPRAHSLFRAPRILTCGDLHLENFGAFKGDNRLCYFDVNDFDDACLAPFTLDIVRFVASIKIAAHGLGCSRAQSKELVQRFFKAYRRSVSDGKPRWVERSLAQGVFRALLRRAMNRTRRDLLARFTKLKGGERRIRYDGVRALSVEPAERAPSALRRAVGGPGSQQIVFQTSRRRTPHRGQRQFRVGALYSLGPRPRVPRSEFRARS